jgi:hypothetical protein
MAIHLCSHPLWRFWIIMANKHRGGLGELMIHGQQAMNAPSRPPRQGRKGNKIIAIAELPGLCSGSGLTALPPWDI